MLEVRPSTFIVFNYKATTEGLGLQEPPAFLVFDGSLKQWQEKRGGS